MKKYLFLVVFSMNFLTVSAQKTANTEGVILFEEKVNLHRRLPDPEMKAMVPEFRSSKTELYFKGDECLYKPVEEDDDEREMGGGGMRMRFARPAAEIYRNFATDKRIEQRDAMGKKFLIEDTLKVIAWKLTTESKKILNYDCVKATYEDTTRKQKIAAWFTEGITLTAGPATFGSLPGMILGLDINNGEMQYTALKVEFKTVKADDLKAPSKGEKISDADYRKKMQEMFQRNGGNIRIQRN